MCGWRSLLGALSLSNRRVPEVIPPALSNHEVSPSRRSLDTSTFLRPDEGGPHFFPGDVSNSLGQDLVGPSQDPYSSRSSGSGPHCLASPQASAEKVSPKPSVSPGPSTSQGPSAAASCPTSLSQSSPGSFSPPAGPRDLSLSSTSDDISPSQFYVSPSDPNADSKKPRLRSQGKRATSSSRLSRRPKKREAFSISM